MIRSFRVMTYAIAFVAALSFFSTTRVNAAALTNFGTQFPATGESDPTGGAILAAMTTAFSSPTFSGTLESTVLSGDPSNPYGGLTFTFELSNDLSSAHPLGRLTLNGWDGWLTDVSYNIDSVGIRPAVANRPISDVIGFTFLDIPVFGDGLVTPGASSRLLVIQTNATSFVENVASVIDGFVASTPTYSPVPEPATLGMMGVGLVALIARRKR